MKFDESFSRKNYSCTAEAAKDRAADALGATQPEKTETKAASAGAANAVDRHKTDELTVTLKPGEGAEIKMSMLKGARARYEWRSAGAPRNHDTHGDGPGGASQSFSKGRGVESDSAELTAPFDGNHGWFWRNRSETDASVTLKVSGEYRSVDLLPKTK